MPATAEHQPIKAGLFTKARNCALLLIAMLCAVGCESTPASGSDAPISIMLDNREDDSYRRLAARQAKGEQPRSQARINALKKMSWQPGYHANWRNYAVDELVEVSEVDAQAHLSRVMARINDWRTIAHISELAAERSWRSFIPTLVRSWSVPEPTIKDIDRPERKAIAQLAQSTPTEVVWQVFQNDISADANERAAAWQLLYRLSNDDRQAMADYLIGIEPLPGDAMVFDMQAALVELSVLPVNIETVTRVRLIASDLYPGFWEQAQRAVKIVPAEYQSRLNLRHLPILVFANQESTADFNRSRDQLAQQVILRLQNQMHHLQQPPYGQPRYPQLLEEHLPELSWADLLTITCLLDQLADAQVTASLFEQADADLADGATEHGGIIVVDKGSRPVARAYPPMTGGHDLKYFPAQQLILDAPTALAHYHFHAQSIENARYACPGKGDRGMVERQQVHGLVFTFVTADILNVDYYAPAGIAIDLGEIHRPVRE